MKLQLIDQAYNIPNFDNQSNELVDALNLTVSDIEYSKIRNQESIVFYGFKLALDMIEQYPQLIKPTLYQTMITVKQRYRQLTKFSHNHKQISAVSLAVNHLQYVNRIAINEVQLEEYKRKYKQQKQEAKVVNQLADEIRKMLKQAKVKDGVV